MIIKILSSLLLIGLLILVFELKDERFDPGGSLVEYILNHSVHSSSILSKARKRRGDCNFYKCFDINRCTLHAANIKVHIYPSHHHLVDGEELAYSREYLDIIDAVYNSEFYTPNPEEACLFMPSVDTLNLKTNRKELESVLSQLEYWNQGQNHLIFNFIGDPAEFWLDKAILASSSLSTYTYRPEFDVSLPLSVPDSLACGSGSCSYNQSINQHSSSRRSWTLLVFKHTLDIKLAKTLHDISADSNDVIFVDKCGNTFCYKGVEYSAEELIADSKYCFISGVPGLQGLQLGQVLRLGCVPVILQGSSVLPFSEILDWNLFSIRLRGKDVGDLLKILNLKSAKDYQAMKKQLERIYSTYMKSPGTIALTTLKIFNTRILTQFGVSKMDWNLEDSPKSPIFLDKYPRPGSGFTAVILAYDRVDSLFQIINQISDVHSLTRILVIWNHQTIPPPSIQAWPKTNKQLKVIQTSANLLSNRFYPYPEIDTECVLSLDDDITMLSADELEFGYQIWREFPDRIVGFPSRSHFLNQTSGAWNYQSEWTNEYSMVLTGAAFYNKYWNYVYTGAPDPQQKLIRDWVDENMNCEDVAFNFLVSNHTRKPHIKIGPRKKYRCVTPSCENGNMLSQDSGHLARRSQCVDKFSKLYGFMPLKSVEYRLDPTLYKETVPDSMNPYSHLGPL
ncbi:exostosin-2 [Eurytemora carolleeae]|uniref:exostosin-2 n=1 Tax=Eurytemora carolleeae TaxID=1294199 RepID=UPI000C76419B|nr:exostosin-2 [Eurytemora carolleeae]XP_023321308.1 exostosin-2 [Eurytemora carolleeae]|eukprot:XP_023321307.1 exostosin-2-like [Eurytemora affinis]